MAEYATRFAAAGARLIGGCCGTTPIHTRKMREALRASAKSGVAPAPWTDRHAQRHGHHLRRYRAAADPADRTRLSRKLADKEFVVSVEVDPPAARAQEDDRGGAVLEAGRRRRHPASLNVFETTYEVACRICSG